MFRLFYTPGWFNGIDLVFDFVGLVIALMIASYSWRVYKVSKDNKFFYFSGAFILISLSLIFKSFTHSVLYFTPIRDSVALALAPAVGPGLKFADLFYRGAFFVQMFSMLTGLLLIFFISQKSRERLRKLHEVTQISLFVYLVLLISVVSNFKHSVFYLTSVVLLGLIVLNYYKNYLNTGRNSNAYKVMFSFFLILVGNINFVFIEMSTFLYVIGELFVLSGFLLLLFTYRTVRRVSESKKLDLLEEGDY